ncbi:MAG: FdtA/QdtA family cupin domain-containing protein [Sediminibacterium sp.]|nr:FdtA/QdtA family cupin domain-containing protein [Sediminibacterium sp.]
MNKINDCKLITLPKFETESGCITVIENYINISFAIKRIYYLYDIPAFSERGGHAHYHLEQYVIAASGSFVFVLDDSKEKKEVFLNNPNQALHIKAGIWREIKNFSSGSICLVLASDIYKEEDYIRDYNEFLNYKVNERTM